MIPKNLKIGDTFEDGNSTYEIIRVLKDGNYISKRVECNKLVEKDKFLEEKAEDKKYTKTQINRMSIAELKKLANEYGIEATGGSAIKKAIIEKLEL
ncbi:MAG: DUF116 domain-containing protein [Clostridiales bacterium]|mgnify:FL=1|nr:DUF116 domain-containing protein [Clostridiales bacterium]